MTAPTSASEVVPRRVLMTADAVGGVWTYALDLSRGLAAQGVGVTLAVLGPQAGAARRAEAEAVAGLELVETGLPMDWTAMDAAQSRAAGRALAALAGRSGADLVHLNSPALAAGAAFPVPVLGVAHSCVKTWWDAVRSGPPPDDFRWRAALLAEGYAACDALAAPSAAFAAETERAYGVPVAVIRNGHAARISERASPRERLVVAAGRLWDEAKGASTFDAACALIDAPADAYGPLVGPQGQAVALHHARSHGSVEAEALQAALARARIFASPACYEPFGLAVLEAAQAGCALVLSDIATFRELWEGAAVFVPPGDAQALAAAMRRLLDDAGAAQRMAIAARTSAARYGLEPFVGGVLDLYRRVLDAAPRRRAEAAA